MSIQDKLTEERIAMVAKEVEESCLVRKDGGPFGAVVFKDGEVVGVGFNNVLKDKNPVHHAEIQAIGDACETLDTFDLTGCELYATGYPCPMCMSAIIWANIKKVYYSADYKDAKKIGFRDDHINKFIKHGCKDTDVLELVQVPKKSIVELYKKYHDNEGGMY